MAVGVVEPDEFFADGGFVLVVVAAVLVGDGLARVE